MAMLMTRSAFGAARAAPVTRMVASARVAPVARPSSSSSFLGGSFSGAVMAPAAPARGQLVVMANAKKSIACTKEGTNQKRARASGFRTRMETPNGRKVLKARRAKGRHVICPASQKKSGGKK